MKMQKVLFSIFAFGMLAASAPASAAGQSSSATCERPALTITSILAGRSAKTSDVYSQCYYECKPQSGGDEGDGYSRCLRACLARYHRR